MQFIESLFRAQGKNLIYTNDTLLLVNRWMACLTGSILGSNSFKNSNGPSKDIQINAKVIGNAGVCGYKTKEIKTTN